MYFVGADVGSLTTKVALIDREGRLLFSSYRRNEEGPIEAIRQAFAGAQNFPAPLMAAGTTGSGRQLASVIVGADTVVNEITAHALAARTAEPEVRTVIDIGGQDSKIIYLKKGVSVGFNMNTVCAAGTGSFLDHQAARLNIPIEELGDYALRATSPVAIAGRCGVFAESDLIHKQQLGYRREDLIAGLCLALAKNYLTNVARNRKAEPIVLFQGGVAANIGIRWALEQLLGVDLVIPEHFKVMGAYGAALLARQRFLEGAVKKSAFRGASTVAESEYRPQGFICDGCANSCEISELYISGKLAGRWGSRCGKWESGNLNTAPSKG
ncbi:MAG: 2-hydroxyglutaryl-CoA dehydratase [Firmicutes bacterium]|nr:2-hydroxyglutaryl-CoA dehydratase [Bacillota bacterium]